MSGEWAEGEDVVEGGVGVMLMGAADQELCQCGRSLWAEAEQCAFKHNVGKLEAP